MLAKIVVVLAVSAFITAVSATAIAVRAIQKSNVATAKAQSTANDAKATALANCKRSLRFYPLNYQEHVNAGVYTAADLYAYSHDPALKGCRTLVRQARAATKKTGGKAAPSTSGSKGDSAGSPSAKSKDKPDKPTPTTPVAQPAPSQSGSSTSQTATTSNALVPLDVKVCTQLLRINCK